MGSYLGDIGDIENLAKHRRRALSFFLRSIIVLVACLALRFIPHLNDALSSTPEYARVLSESFAQQVAAQ